MRDQGEHPTDDGGYPGIPVADRVLDASHNDGAGDGANNRMDDVVDMIQTRDLIDAELDQSQYADDDHEPVASHPLESWRKLDVRQAGIIAAQRHGEKRQICP